MWTGRRGRNVTRPALRIVASAAPTPAHDPARRGYVVTYRQGQANHCPGCGRAHWYIGRLTAECAFCATAVALAEGLVA